MYRLGREEGKAVCVYGRNEGRHLGMRDGVGWVGKEEK